MSSKSTTSGQGGGGNGSGTKNQKKSQTPCIKPQINTTKFHGACEALKDRIFDCSDYKQADGYVNTIKRIGEYVGTEYKHGGDICTSIMNEGLFTIPRPTAPTAQDPANLTLEEHIDAKIFDKEINAYIK